MDNNENVAIFNAATMTTIAAKQNAIMHMLATLLATNNGGDAADIFNHYKNIAREEAELLGVAYNLSTESGTERK